LEKHYSFGQLRGSAD